MSQSRYNTNNSANLRGNIINMIFASKFQYQSVSPYILRNPACRSR